MAHMKRKINIAANPHSSRRPNAATRKKGQHMAKPAKKAKNKAAGYTKKKNRKPNPTKRRRGHRNPSGLAGIIGSPKDLITGGFAGLVSAVATRQLPQMILGAGNTGVEGYAANFLTTIAATWLAGSFAGPAAGKGALLGGTVIVLDRVLSEQVSPIAPYLSLSGVGDPSAYSKLGTIRTGYYAHPSLQNPDGSYYVPQPFIDQSVQAAMARMPVPVSAANMGAVNPSALRRHSASGMVLSSRFQGRFNQ